MQHTNTIADDALYHKSPIIRAASVLATDCHSHMGRDKLDASIRYISHPNMVYKLLRDMGETDEIFLASALLHDALEDCPRYKTIEEMEGKSFQMHQDFCAELQKEGIGAEKAEEIAAEVMVLVRQVTNPKERREGKRIEQIERLTKATPHAKMLKIVDHLASRICRILAPDDPEIRSPHDAPSKLNDSLNLVEAIYDTASYGYERDLLRPWRNFFLRVAGYDKLLSAAERAKDPVAEKRVREEFRQQVMHMGHELHLEADRRRHVVDAELSLPQPAGQAHQFGLARVAFDAYGEVVAYTMWVAPHEDKHYPRNRRADHLCKEIEAGPPAGHVHIRPGLTPVEVKDTGTLQEGRLYEVDPMPVGRFLRFTGAAQVVDAAGAVNIRTEAERIATTIVLPNVERPYAGVSRVKLNRDGRVIGFRLREDDNNPFGMTLEGMASQFHGLGALREPDVLAQQQSPAEGGPGWQKRSFFRRTSGGQYVKAPIAEAANEKLSITHGPVLERPGGREQDFRLAVENSMHVWQFTAAARRAGIMDARVPQGPHSSIPEMMARAQNGSQHIQSNYLTGKALEREAGAAERPSSAVQKLLGKMGDDPYRG